MAWMLSMTNCSTPIVVVNTPTVVRRTTVEQTIVSPSQGATIVVQRSTNSVRPSGPPNFVNRDIVETQIIRALTPGPQGPPGPTGDNTFTVTAGANLSYPIIVAIDNGVATPADPTNIADMSSQLAVTTQAAISGTPVVVATSYSLTEPMWTWSPGRVYLAPSGGQLTQTLPTVGALLEVGRAVSATTIDFNIQTAILL
jgi:hypothetical protein